MNIITINIADQGGGSQTIARNIHEGLLDRRHVSYIVVERKHSDDDHVLLIRDKGIWEKSVRAVVNILTPYTETVRGAFRIEQTMLKFARPNARRFLSWLQGREMMNYPSTQHLLKRAPIQPDLLHAHTLHGYYFDLRQLVQLSQQLPVMITLHDMWMLTGHCAHSFDCERWKTGCGKCPYLNTYPAVIRDATDRNFTLKQEIYQKSRFYIATPSQWLMDQVKQSMLQSAIIKQRVIPNGVDVEVFAPPQDKMQVRRELGLPEDALILMFAASSLRANPYKDYKTLRAALEQLDLSNINQPVVFLGLGQVGTDIVENDLTIQFVPFQSDPKRVAMYYQASDIYVHPARADTFPTTILEASACGLPVIATDICGIPEQVKSYGEYKQDDATGILTPLGDAKALTTAILQLLQNKSLRHLLGNNARQHVLDNFTHSQFIDAYVNWYEEILGDN